jgi:hypothetical protein
MSEVADMRSGLSRSPETSRTIIKHDDAHPNDQPSDSGVFLSYSGRPLSTGHGTRLWHWCFGVRTLDPNRIVTL